MKTLIFFLFIVPSLVFAKTEIIESGAAGFSHIDPLDNQVFMSVKTDLKNGNPRFRVRCKLDKNQKPIKNYFIFKMPDTHGIIRNFKAVKPEGYSCAQIEKDHPEVQGRCQEFSAPEVTVEEPEANKCGDNQNEACTYLDQPVEKQIEKPINLNADSVVKARDACGGANNPLILVHDMVSDHSLFSNLSGESFCNMDKRRITLDGAPWDSGSPYNHIFTSNKPGFNVGAMVNPANPNQADSVFNYNYDFEKKSWCQHVLPDYGNSSPTCDPAYSNGSMTFPLSYAPPYGGIIKLKIENGIPVAYIGQPAKTTLPGAKFPDIDPAKPLIKVTLMKSSEFGALTVFESKPNLDGEATRKVTVSPTYTMGSRFNATLAANSCDKSMCLRAPTTLANNSGNLSCSANFESLSLQKSNSDVCYSCNGVTPGTCNKPRENTGAKDTLGNDVYKSLKTMITSENAENSFNLLNQCRGTVAAPSDNAQDPIIDQ